MRRIYLFKHLIVFLIVVCGTVAGEIKCPILQVNCLAPNSSKGVVAARQIASELLAENIVGELLDRVPKMAVSYDRDLPIFEMLKLLGLEDPNNIPGVKTRYIVRLANGSIVQRVKIVDEKNRYGFLMLANEMMETSRGSNHSVIEFDIVYNPDAEPVAIVPAVVRKHEIDDKYTYEKEKFYNIRELNYKYFEQYSEYPSIIYLTQYYVLPPQVGDSDFISRWEDIDRRIDSDVSFVREYNSRNSNTADVFCKGYRKTADLFIVLEKGKGKWGAQRFRNRRDTRVNLQDEALGKDVLIVPLLPTVYNPQEGQETDSAYYKYISDNIPANSDVLVLGPGSGADAWAAWIASGRSARINVVGVNPFEIANTRITARIAGFEISSERKRIKRNTAREGLLAKRYDVVIWNMPFLSLGYQTWLKSESLEGDWDGDSGEALVGIARLLPGIIKPRGKAILWNSRITGYKADRKTQIDLVQSVLASAGRRVVSVNNYGSTDDETELVDVESIYCFSNEFRYGGHGKSYNIYVVSHKTIVETYDNRNMGGSL